MILWSIFQGHNNIKRPITRLIVSHVWSTQWFCFQRPWETHNLEFQGHGVITDSLDVLCTQLTRALFAIAKFLLRYLTLNNIVTLKSGLEVTQGYSNWYHSKSWVLFPICLPSSIIFEIKRYINRKSRFFSYALAFDAPVWGSPSKCCHPIWCGKTRMVGLPDGGKKLWGFV